MAASHILNFCTLNFSIEQFLNNLNKMATRMNKEDMEEIKSHFDTKANEMIAAAETRVMTLCAANTAIGLANKEKIIETTKQTRFAELSNRHNSKARAKILIILNVNKDDKNEKGEAVDDETAALMYIENAIKEYPIGFNITKAYIEKVTRTKFITFPAPRPNSKGPKYPNKDKLKVTFVHESFRNLVYNSAKRGGHEHFIRDMSQMDRYYFDHIFFAVDQLNADPNGTHWYTISDATIKSTRARNPGETRKDPPSHRRQPKHPGKLTYEFPSYVAQQFGAGADDAPVDEEMEEIMSIPVQDYVAGPSTNDQANSQQLPQAHQPPPRAPQGTVQNNIYVPRASNPGYRFPNIQSQPNQSQIFHPRARYALGGTPCSRGDTGNSRPNLGAQLAIQNMQRMQNMSSNQLVSQFPHTSTPMPSKTVRKFAPNSKKKTFEKKSPKRSASSKRRTSPIERPKKNHVQPSFVLHENSSEDGSECEDNSASTPTNPPAAQNGEQKAANEDAKLSDDSQDSFNTANSDDEEDDDSSSESEPESELNSTVKKKSEEQLDKKAMESASKRPIPMEGENCLDFDLCYEILLEKHKLFADEPDKERILNEMSSDVQILHFLATAHKDNTSKEVLEWRNKCLKEVLGLVSINFQSLETITIIKYNYMEIEEKCIAIYNKKATPLVTSVLPTEQIVRRKRRDYLFKKNSRRGEINQQLESSILSTL